MKTNKAVAALLALTVAGVSATFLASVSACGNAQTVEIAGSTSVQPLMGALADAYMAKNRGVQVYVEGGGSAIGVSNAKEGKGDFGMASKAVEKNGITTVKLCDDGIVVVVNKENMLTDVSSLQLFNFYVFGCALGLATVPVTREAGAGTREAFEGLVKNEKGESLENVVARAPAQEFSSTGTSITYIQRNANALGYISLGAHDPAKVKKLSFEGVEASAQTIKNGSYKLARPFNILYNTKNGLSETARSFLAFVLSKEGQQIVAEEGYIAL